MRGCMPNTRHNIRANNFKINFHYGLYFIIKKINSMILVLYCITIIYIKKRYTLCYLITYVIIHACHTVFCLLFQSLYTGTSYKSKCKVATDVKMVNLYSS